MAGSSTENHFDIFYYIRQQSASLTQAQQNIAQYLLSHQSFAVNHTAYEVAADAGVSEATVIRFCQAIGFKGYRELRVRMARDLGNSDETPVPSGISHEDSAMQVVEKMMLLESEDIRFCLQMLDRGSVENVLKLINQANLIAFFGIGSSSIAAESAKEHFLYYGKKASAETESYEQIALANSLTPDDLAIAISISGQSRIPLEAVQLAKDAGVPTVCITQNPDSELTRICDHRLICRRKSTEYDDLGTSTRIVLISVIDALAVAWASGNWERSASTVKENRKHFRFQRVGGVRGQT